MNRISSQNKFNLTKMNKETAEKYKNDILPRLSDLNYKPSTSQMACAAIASLLFSSHKRQLITIPPGKGKSRVVCAIATIFKKVKKSVKRIFITFPSEILMKTDKVVYERLNDILGSDLEIKLSVGTSTLDMNSHDLLILDEADWHLFDDIC